MIIAATGLQREARIAAGDDVQTVCCGGRSDVLAGKLRVVLDGNVSGIISFGVCGGLSSRLRPGDCIIATEIVTGSTRIHTDRPWSERLSQRLPKAITGPLAGTDVLLQSAAQKHALFVQTGALAADMESHIAADAARRHQIPFVCLRAVADAADSDLPQSALSALDEHGCVQIRAVLQSVLKNPHQLPALIRAARSSNAAFAALFRCRGALGRGLAGPNLGEPAFDVA